MSATPNSLSVAAGPFQGLSHRQLQMVIAYLLQQIAGNTMTANQLAVASACFNCFDERNLILVQTYLLSQIAGGGMVGGVGAVYSGLGAPSVTPTANAALYYDYTIPSAPKVYNWDGVAWTKFIG